ncbi:hypothetical protein LR48_Vigan02g068900 [Vigna angularis]|uniref:Uncharacterized protein n=1 Tax=Phaseolus angularis TaxID=3914 RepID=A0A0L9TWJ4_PHAAN|nr:hypothetical protein LR48_Vigan02g068900 [Vigna angularis]
MVAALWISRGVVARLLMATARRDTMWLLMVAMDSGVILENAMVAVTRWRRRLRVVACGGPIKVARWLGGGPM